MPRFPEALLLCGALVACAGETPDTTDPETDAPTDSEPAVDTEPAGDTDDTDEEGTRLRFILQDFSTETLLEGVAYSADGYAGTTDASGEFRIWAPPGSIAKVSLTAAGYPQHDLYQWAPPTDSFFTNALLAEATIAQLAGALQIQVDPTKGILVVGLSDWDGGDASPANLPGVTVSLDAGYDAALASDASSPFGVSPGTTTLADSSSDVTFVNLPAGEVAITITPPDGYVCANGPTTVEVIAGGVVAAAIYCSPE